MWYVVIYNYQQRSLLMKQDQLLEFAKENKLWNAADLPKGFKFFCVYGTKKWYSYGDLNDDDRIFLIVAPNKEAALTWAQFEYLAFSDSSIQTYKELQDQIKENTIDINHPEYSRFEGFLDAGDFQYRSIDSVEKISKSEAKILSKRDAFNYTNFCLS